MSTPGATIPSRETLRRTWWRWTIATVAAMIVGGFFTGMYVAGRYEARLGRLERETYRLREDLRGEESALRERAAFYQRVVDLLRDPATRVIALRAPWRGGEPQGRVVWHDTAGGYLFVSKLPPAPDGTAYELWTIARGRPRRAGMLHVAASGQAVERVEPTPSRVDAFTVTQEAVGGAQAPTGPAVLISAK